MDSEKLAPKWVGLPVCLTLLAAVFAVYLPVWHGQFLWDDGFLVLRNPLIRSPILAGEIFCHYLFLDSPSSFYRPVQNLSYMVDYWRAGLNAAAFHQTNLLIHSINAMLIFFLMRNVLQRLGKLRSQTAAVVSGLIALGWALHPVHSAITAYISGRADSLALAGILAGWLCWESGIKKYQAGQSRAAAALWLLSAFLTLLGLCGKEIGSMGLVLFLTYLWGLRSDLGGQLRGKTTCGIVLIFGTYLTLRQLPEKISGATPPYAFSWWERGELFLRALGDYGRLLVYPRRLFMERQVIWPNGLLVNSARIDPWFIHLTWLGGLVLVLLISSIIWKAPGRSLRLFGACWFLIMILPVSNLIPLNATVAEHWLYIPSVGFFLWLAGCWVPFQEKGKWLFFVLATVFLAGLGGRSFSRAGEWKDGVTFFKTTIESGGDSARMRINLAGEYWVQGKAREVEAIYRSVLKARPGNVWVEGLLAQVLLAQGKKQEADELVGNASRQVPGPQNEQVVLIDYLLKNKDYSQAVARARKAYESSPNSWLLASTLASIYSEQNRPHVALQVVRGFAGRHWWSSEAQNELGRLSSEVNQLESALAAYQMAARLDVRNAESLNQSAALLANAHRFSEALDLQNQALARDPGSRQKELLRLIQKAAAEGQ